MSIKKWIEKCRIKREIRSKLHEMMRFDLMCFRDECPSHVKHQKRLEDEVDSLRAKLEALEGDA